MFAELVRKYHLHPIVDHFTIALLTFGIAAELLSAAAMLLSRGRIQAYGTVEASISLLTDGVVIKPITPEIAAISAQFPADFPQDPADRLIAATAKAEGVALITRDERLRRSPILQTIW